MVALDSNAVLVRLKGGLELSCQLESTDASHAKQNLSQAFTGLLSRIRCKCVVFSIPRSPVFIWPNKSVWATPAQVTGSTTCRELHMSIGTDENDSNKRSSKKKERKSAAPTVINMELLMDVTEPGSLCSLSLMREEGKHQLVRMKVPLDCVVVAGEDDPLHNVCARLLEALCTQLEDMQKVTLKHMKGTSIPIPKPFHFLLPKPAGLVTLVYPTGVPDSQLEAFRKEMHISLNLPEDRPYLRRANAYRFPDEPFRDGYLRNPHLTLNQPSLEGAKPYLVQGVYSYHHYMQDRMDDNGWGCAYRSLQTICSWFQQQAYVERDVPSHREIQQALVDIGDKPAAFVGSRQWIGSFEVQAVLSQLLGVTSKILFVSQGSDLPSKGRDLANHFEAEGSPVMIGGGVLAHTILGVMWSESTGEIRFLILDPHYTGAEDLQVITDKGWCSWKGPDFWDQTAYYNLCLPQRPRTL